MNLQKLRPFVFVLTGFLILSGCTKKSNEDQSAASNSDDPNIIKVGEVGSMTGSEATFGISTHNGIELAFKEINAKGGVKGKKLQLISVDDQGKPEEAATAVTKLITQNKVRAILGEVASGRSLAMAPIAQQYKVPMITPSSTNPKVTETGNYIFRVCFIDPFQGTVMARFALEQLKIKRVAILRDMKNDYSVGLAEFFAETFKKGGGEIVAEQIYSAGDIDFKAQLLDMKSKKPQAIFVPGYYTEVGLIARQQKRDLKWDIPLLGGDGWDSPKLQEIGGEYLNGSYFSNHYSQEEASPQVQEFVKKYKDAYNSVPDGLAAMGYDAALVLTDAMNRTKNLTNEEVREELAKTKDFQMVTGKISMDTNRNPVKSAVVLKVESSGFKYHSTVKP